jgi:hypothetical protein
MPFTRFSTMEERWSTSARLVQAYPGLNYSVALGINDHDQIVGYSYIQYGPSDMMRQAGFVFGGAPGAAMVNLNDVISPTGAVQYWVFAATAINDNGQIAACAYRDFDGVVHAVLLTPMGQ